MSDVRRDTFSVYTNKHTPSADPWPRVVGRLGWLRTTSLVAYVAHRVLADGLDHVLCGRPTNFRHQCRDLEAGVSRRTGFRDVAVRVQLNEDAVHFDNVLIKLLRQRCHESLVAVDAFMSLNPGTLPLASIVLLLEQSYSWFRRNRSCSRLRCN